jgi:MGT family glycosyltransferase
MSIRTPRRILFTTFDGGGNVAPIMAVVSKLVQRGHFVRLMSDEVNRAEAEAVGARFVSWERAPNKLKPDRDQDPRDWEAPTAQQGVQDLAQHFICGLALAYAEDVMAELQRTPADLVINFDLLLGVMMGCEARGQKLALLSTMISTFPLPGVPPFGAGLMPAQAAEDRSVHARKSEEFTRLFDVGLDVFNAARSKLGLAPLAHVLDQAHSALVRWLGTARAFDFSSGELPPDVRYVGPLVRDPVWASDWVPPSEAGDARPLIVVGFSTSFQNHAGCVQRVIDACAELSVRVLVTLGGSIYTHELVARANTRIVDHAPHNEVMRSASLVVTHGGHGTVMTALVHSLPLLVIPHGRDQGDNAVRVTRRGAGLSLPPAASVSQLRAAVSRLLEEPSFRIAAQRLGELIAAEVQGSRLIEEIESLAGSAASDTNLSRRANLIGLFSAE